MEKKIIDERMKKPIHRKRKKKADGVSWCPVDCGDCSKDVPLLRNPEKSQIKIRPSVSSS